MACVADLLFHLYQPSDLSPPMRLDHLRAALRNNTYSILLVVLQAALACAVSAIALGVMSDRFANIATDIGVPESGLAIIGATDVGNPEERIQRRKDAIARISAGTGNQAVAVISMVPLGPKDTAIGVCADKATFDAAVAAGSIERPGCAMPSVYSGSPEVLKALGAKVVDGRDFNARDFDVPQPRTVIVTSTFGRTLYGDRPIVGQLLQAGPDNALRIVGVVEDVIKPHPAKSPSDTEVVFVPEWTADKSAFYLVRSPSGVVDSTGTNAVRTIAAASHRVIIEHGRARSLAELRHAYFSRDYSLLEILSVTVAALLLVTTAGIFSLSWQWVLQRRKSIGIRRALGAKRKTIVHHFLLENACVVACGATAGALAAAAAPLWAPGLHVSQEHRLPSILIAFAATLLIGQIAAFIPAMRAARIHPAISTRAD
jgi:putative ABC transport system permease protein